MDRATISTVLLVGSLLLAGCSGFSDSPASTTGTTDSAATTETTSVDSTTTTESSDRTRTTTSNADLPPGVSEDGLADAGKLADAHRTNLANVSFTYSAVTHIESENGTQIGQAVERAQVGPERSRVNYTQSGWGTSMAGYGIDALRVYSNGSVTFRNASEYEGGYVRSDGYPYSSDRFVRGEHVREVFGSLETTSVEAVQRNGETMYRIRGEGENRTFTVARADGSVDVLATNTSVVALVKSDGTVHELVYSYNFTRGDASGYRKRAVSYSAIGTTTVERPTWVDDATNATSE